MNENFTTYTEVDPGDDLTIAAAKITGVAVTGSADEYVYKDYTANHFDALDVDFEILVADGGANIYGVGGPAITNTLEDTTALASTDLAVVAADRGGAGVGWVRFLRGAFADEDRYVGSVDTLYYCTITRAAGNDTVVVTVYSDSARTTLLDTLTLSGFGTTKYRYSMGFVNDGADGYLWSGYVQNMIFNEAVAGTNMKLNVGDTWKTVSAAKVNIGDTWKAVSKAQVNVGDTWKSVF